MVRGSFKIGDSVFGRSDVETDRRRRVVKANHAIPKRPVSSDQLSRVMEAQAPELAANLSMARNQSTYQPNNGRGNPARQGVFSLRIKRRRGTGSAADN